MTVKLHEIFDISLDSLEAIHVQINNRSGNVKSGFHRSAFGSPEGSSVRGVREWQPGDPISQIHWGHSSLTGFNPMLITEREPEKNIHILVVADASHSTRVGIGHNVVGRTICNIIAALGVSASMMQDKIGLFLFGTRDEQHVKFGSGTNHVQSLMRKYVGASSIAIDQYPDIKEVVYGNLRGRSLVVLVTDFLFDNDSRLLDELEEISSKHDVVVVIADGSVAFEVPNVSSGWINALDVETLEPRQYLASDLQKVAASIGRKYSETIRYAQKKGISITKTRGDRREILDSLFELFSMHRRR